MRKLFTESVLWPTPSRSAPGIADDARVRERINDRAWVALSSAPYDLSPRAGRYAVPVIEQAIDGDRIRHHRPPLLTRLAAWRCMQAICFWRTMAAPASHARTKPCTCP